MVAARLVTVTRTLNSLKKEWDRQEDWPAEDRTRGAIVRSKLSGLGPCFVKIGQTLSQRPDVVCEPKGLLSFRGSYSHLLEDTLQVHN